MEFHLLTLFAVLCLLARSINASLPAEEYWQSQLPNNRMPKALQDLLQTDMGNDTVLYTGPMVGDLMMLYDLFNYNYAAGGGQLDKNAISNTTVFFLYNDLHPNTKMSPVFTKSNNKAPFLSRQVAESIHFSSDKLPEILQRYSKAADSVEADMIRNTLEECEEPNIEGEDKYCATSLESLVDFNVAKLGKSLQILSPAVQEDTKKQDYTISRGVKMIGGNEVICHKMRYPYAVFYCHFIKATRVYMVPLVGADGTVIKAVAICHMDTSAWNPHHISFQVLKVKPGPPICHFPGSDVLIWISN